MHLAQICTNRRGLFYNNLGFELDFLLPEDSVRCSLQQMSIFSERHSLENASGHKKWREKLGENANELLIMQSLNVIEKIRKKKTAITRNNGLVTQDNPQTSTSIVFMLGLFCQGRRSSSGSLRTVD